MHPLRRTAPIALALVATLIAAPLALLAPPPAHAAPETPLLDANSTWRYNDSGTDPADGLDDRTGWALPEYDDTAWPAASGSFGALRGEHVALSGGFMPTNLLTQYREDGTNNEAYFFRTSFSVELDELPAGTDLTGSLYYDDAAIVYVNGTRITGFADTELVFAETGERRNMVYGGSNRTAPLLGEFTVPRDALVDGENTIAVQLHQGRASSSDIYFGFSSLEMQAPVDVAGAGPTSLLMGIGASPSERRLSWFTDSGVEEHVQLAAGEHTELPADARRIMPETRGASADRGNDYVHATLDGLTEGTYTYRVGSNEGGWSALTVFTVHADTLEHEFTFVGDPQLGASRNLESDAAGWQRALDANDTLFPNSQFLLSAGDQVETYAGNVDEYRQYIQPAQMRSQPHAATLGNHDFASVAPQALYGQHYNQPNLWADDPTGGNYWFVYNNVLHLNISTEYRNWDEHRRFLTEVIAEQGERVHWTMLTFHRPLFSAGPHSQSGTTAGVREGLAPIIDDLDIDIVLNGHDHTYARSFVMHAGQPVELDRSVSAAAGEPVVVEPGEGETLFLTANSSSGSKYYDLRDPSLTPWAAFTWQGYEQTIMNVAVGQCSIDSRTVTLDGTTVDAVSVRKDKVAPTLIGADDVRITVGDAFDALDGVSADDPCGDAAAVTIEADGEVDTTRAGEYSVTYLATDAAGNVSNQVRTVTVAAAPVSPGDGGAGDQGAVPGGPDTTAPQFADADAQSAATGTLVRTGAAIVWAFLAVAAVLGALGYALTRRRARA